MYKKVFSKTSLIFALLGLITLGLSLLLVKEIKVYKQNVDATASVIVTPLAETQKVSPFASLLEPIHTKPVSLKAESINLDLDLVEVGVKDTGAMETPADWYSAGWYKNSSKAGDKGNMVINGHYDTNRGAAAAFWSLSKLAKGAVVEVTDLNNEVFTYKVTESFYVGINDPERLDVVSSSLDAREMTLITCGGVWNSAKQTYDRRLVVKGVLVESGDLAMETGTN